MFSTRAVVQVIPNPVSIGAETTCLITALVDENISRYYRHLTNQALYMNLAKPGWKCHVTISKINPVIPIELDKKCISIQYNPFVRFSGDVPIKDETPEWKRKIGKYWFLEVVSDDIREIRRSLGLPDFEKFHVTIGVKND